MVLKLTDEKSLRKLLSRGRKATERGNFDKAREIALEILDELPGNLAALHIYFDSTKIAPNDAVMERLERFCANRTIKPKLRSQLFFMLGKGYADQKQHEQAFEAFIKANKLTGKTANANATASLSKSLISQVKNSNLPILDVTPPQIIFILGMPRSGTSIMAQSLSRHSQIKSLGESVGLGDALRKAGWGDLSGDTLAEFMSSLDEAKLEQIRQDYLTAIGFDPAKPERVFVDKMPENYWFAWIIRSCFPNAQIVHMKRPPLANCWSCFRHDFQDGHHYSYDFPAMMAHYAIYSDMTEEWNKQSPENWLNVELETFVKDPKTTLETILGQSALAFEPACLEPEKHTGKVSTLSKWQVRQGLSSNISEDWKNYLPFIKRRFMN